MMAVQPTDPNQNVEVVGETPPPKVFGSSGGNVLQPSTKLSPRKATSVAPDVVVGEGEYTSAGYTGQNLVDRAGVIARGQYSEDEAFNEIVKLGTPAERFAFLNRLAALGMYGNRKPSYKGTSSADINAMKQALLTANSLGYTVDRAVQVMAADPSFAYARQSTGTRIRTSPKQDLRAVFKQASQNILGRDLSDDEVDKFVRAYNASEVREAQGGPATPSAGVAAEEAVMGAAPEEAGAMRMLGYANAVDQLLKGLG